MAKRNDEERRLWVLNDEGLHRMYIRSRKTLNSFIRANRKVIDEAIDPVLDGTKNPHHLVYG